MALASKLWPQWKTFAHKVASVQARLLFAILYFTLLMPFALLLRLTTHPFQTSGWQKHDASAASPAESARRQF